MSDDRKAPLDGLTPRLRREHVERPLPRRFYESVTLGAAPLGVRLLLDGRGARTPRKAELIVPNAELADIVREEWTVQRGVIDPATMPVTKLVCTSIDLVGARMAEVASEIVAYGGSDLLCYRAASPAELISAQARCWDPVLAWAERDLGARFTLATGLMPVPQPVELGAAITTALLPLAPLALTATHVLTTLTGSAILALAVHRRAQTLEEAWAAAHVDEDWQISQWGADAEAEARRALRLREARAAAQVLAMTGSASEPLR